MRAREPMSTPVMMVRPETPLKEVAELMVAARFLGPSSTPSGYRLRHKSVRGPMTAAFDRAMIVAETRRAGSEGQLWSAT